MKIPRLRFVPSRKLVSSFSSSSSRPADRIQTERTGQRYSHFYLHTRPARRWLHSALPSLSLSPVGCTCDYTSAYLMGRVARGRYLSATPRPLRPSAIPLLNREHLAIYSRCTVSRFPERLCVWQNGCHENRVPFFFVFFLFLARSRSLSLSAYHRVTSLIPIAPYLLATRLDRGPFFTLSLSFFLSFLPFSSSKRR